MSLPVALRADVCAAALRRIAKSTKDAAQGRRLLALAEIYDGGTRIDAARIGGVGLQTVPGIAPVSWTVSGLVRVGSS